MSKKHVRTDKNKAEQLEMSFGKARNLLMRSLFWKLLGDLKRSKCFKCNQEMSEETWSIDHKEPWLHVSADLFWDLENIAFSHKRCNKADRNEKTKLRKIGPEGTAWCSSCKVFKQNGKFSKDSAKWDGLDNYCKECKQVKNRSRKRNTPL